MAITNTTDVTLLSDATVSATSSGTPAITTSKTPHFLKATFTNATGTAKTFTSGNLDIRTLTCAAKAACTAGDFFIWTDRVGGQWAIAVDLTGSDPVPTSPLYTAIPAANKAKVNLSAATSAADVAAAVEAVIDALTGFSAVCATDDSAANGTMTFTTVGVYGPVAAVPALYKANGSASPTSFTSFAATQAGVASTYTVANPGVITTASSGMYTGQPVTLTSSGTLPTGLSTATTYYVIRLSATTMSLASSLANALAGTGIAITAEGTASATHTITPTAAAALNTVLVIEGAQNQADANAGTFVEEFRINGLGSTAQLKFTPNFRYIRARAVVASGVVSVVATLTRTGDTQGGTI